MLRKLIKRNTYLNAMLYIYYNIRIHLKRILLKNKATSSGSTHQALSIDDSTKYITDVFHDYQTVSKTKQFHGKVLELGPGDSNGVALMFLAHGANKVDLADRFYSLRDKSHQDKISQILINEYNIENKDNITRYYGEQAASETFFNHHTGYDVIISRSVLEHIDNPSITLKKMYHSLNPNGMLIHKVDLRDHGMFTPHSHSVKFLEVPKPIYKLMTYGSGYPNRFSFYEYKKLLTNMNPTFYVTGLHGVEPFKKIFPINEIPSELKEQSINFIKQHKPKFAKEFKHIPTEDLIVSSFFFIVHKN